MSEDVKTPFVNDSDIMNKRIVPQVKPEKEIGIDTKDIFYQNIINAGRASALDMGAINSFTQISNSRDQVYNLLDTMAEDSSIAAILETYAEDATEYNDEGKIVWVEAANSDVGRYVNFLLKTLKIDKNIYKWVYSLCKYGDVYIRLYRQSEYNDLLFDAAPDTKALKETFDEKLLKEDISNSGGYNRNASNPINEDILIKAYAKNDKYVRYVEMVPNPAEVFELTRFGKTAGYIQAPIFSTKKTAVGSDAILQTSNMYHFNFKKNDIKIYQPTEFVHACLEDNSSRTPEEVQIFLPKTDLISYDNRKRKYDTEYGSQYENSAETEGTVDDSGDVSISYSVRRGQSLLYSSYKIWRELQLLENAILLSRLTRSSLVRVIEVEVGDMPKESVIPHMMNIKSLIEQKSALTVDGGMNEYTNPGAVENCVYIPTHGGIGSVKMTPIGGDYNIRDIADLDYYQDKFYGSMRVPKQYFGVTDDQAGFDGGTSLSIISSRYAKMIKRIQNTMIQAITDIINLILLNDGLENYINRFTIRMLPPTTREEIDRREDQKNKIDYISSIMDLFNDIDDTPTKLKLLKALLSRVITDTDVITILQDQIKSLESELSEVDSEASLGGGGGEPESSESPFDSGTPMGLDTADNEPPAGALPPMPGSSSNAGNEEGGSESESDTLPSGADLGVDLTDFS